VEPKFRLVPEEIPAISKATVYERIFDEFIAGKASTARVEYNKKPATLHQGLLKAKRQIPRFSQVSVVRRGDAIYLKK